MNSGRFDLAKVAKLINKSDKDVITELGDSIYEDPSQAGQQPMIICRAMWFANSKKLNKQRD